MPKRPATWTEFILDQPLTHPGEDVEVVVYGSWDEIWQATLQFEDWDRPVWVSVGSGEVITEAFGTYWINLPD